MKSGRWNQSAWWCSPPSHINTVQHPLILWMQGSCTCQPTEGETRFEFGMNVWMIRSFLLIGKQQSVSSLYFALPFPVLFSKPKKKRIYIERMKIISAIVCQWQRHCRVENARHSKWWTESNSALWVIRLSLTQRFKISDSFCSILFGETRVESRAINRAAVM